MKGFKTIIYGVLIALIAVLGDDSVKLFVSENFAAVGGLLGTGVVVLRAVTNSAMFKK